MQAKPASEPSILDRGPPQPAEAAGVPGITKADLYRAAWAPGRNRPVLRC